MKRLFVVTIQSDLVVVADNEADAEKHARSTADDVVFAVSVAPLRYLPPAWEQDSIPFGKGDPDDPDRTVAHWIAQGAAPEYVQFKDKLGARLAKTKR